MRDLFLHMLHKTTCSKFSLQCTLPTKYLLHHFLVTYHFATPLPFLLTNRLKIRFQSTQFLKRGKSESSPLSFNIIKVAKMLLYVG